MSSQEDQCNYYLSVVGEGITNLVELLGILQATLDRRVHDPEGIVDGKAADLRAELETLSSNYQQLVKLKGE